MSEAQEWRKRTLYQQLQTTANKFPDSEFMVYNDARPTYRQFLENADRLARSLLALGVKRGDNVAVWMSNCPEWVYTWFACAAIGASVVPINTRYKAHDASYVLKQSDAVALLMKDRFLNIEYLPILAEIAPELAASKPGQLQGASVPQLRTVVVQGEQEYPGTLSYDRFLKMGNAVADAEYRRVQAQVVPDDRVLIIYTSGTTGQPKGAMHNHDMLRVLTRVVDILQLTERDRMLQSAVPFFSFFGTCLIQLATLTGACLVTMDAYDPGVWLKLWAQERCTIINGVPTMFIVALDHPEFGKFDLSSGRTGILGGSYCPVEVVRAIQSRMGLKISTGYGMTETSSTCMSTPYDDPETIATTVGKPIGGFEIKIADSETGEPLPPNTQGEIWTRGAHVMMGYYKKPEETANALDAEGWLHTGDLAAYDERGYYRITGRLKDMYIRGGANVYPAEIEDFLFQHPKIKQVYIVGVPDYRMGEVGMAFVELKEGQQATDDEIVDFCKGKLANYKVPQYVKFVTATTQWPMTPTGKIQKFRLREQAIEELNLEQFAQTRLLDSEKKKG